MGFIREFPTNLPIESLLVGNGGDVIVAFEKTLN